VHDLQEIVNAILYVCRTGIAWEYLPHDFPPYKTVYDYYAKWEADGHRDPARSAPPAGPGRTRPDSGAERGDHRLAERETSCNVGETSQGIDAGKKIKGRKRHIATDALGLLLVAIVTAASVQDSAGGHQVLDQLTDQHPRISKVWVDGGYNNTVIRHGARTGVHVKVAKRPTSKGFHVLPRRWVVERTLGWLKQHRRLVRDYETLPQHSRAMIHWASDNTMSRFLTGESTRTWRINPPKADIAA
jgi:transposase